MPMMAVYEQNDARNSARLLATMTLQELEGRDEVQETVMLNMFRLLDGFRAHSFYGIEDESASKDEFGSTSMLPSGERHISHVRVALRRTLEEFGADPDATIENVENVLRAVTYPELGEADETAKEQARQFLGTLIEKLRYAGV